MRKMPEEYKDEGLDGNGLKLICINDLILPGIKESIENGELNGYVLVGKEKYRYARKNAESIIDYLLSENIVKGNINRKLDELGKPQLKDILEGIKISSGEKLGRLVNTLYSRFRRGYEYDIEGISEAVPLLANVLSEAANEENIYEHGLSNDTVVVLWNDPAGGYYFNSGFESATGEATEIQLVNLFMNPNGNFLKTYTSCEQCGMNNGYRNVAYLERIFGPGNVIYIGVCSGDLPSQTGEISARNVIERLKEIRDK